MASKVLDGDAPGNLDWVRYVGGVFSLKDLNLMERQLLFLLDWDVRITEEDVRKYIPDFRREISSVSREGDIRGRNSGSLESKTSIRRIKDARILIEITECEIEYVM